MNQLYMSLPPKLNNWSLDYVENPLLFPPLSIIFTLILREYQSLPIIVNCSATLAVYACVSYKCTAASS